MRCSLNLVVSRNFGNLGGSLEFWKFSLWDFLCSVFKISVMRGYAMILRNSETFPEVLNPGYQSMEQRFLAKISEMVENC